jgi:hypothetical protein
MDTITKSQAEEILIKLSKLQVDMEYLKSNIIDDSVLTMDDLEAIKEAQKEYNEGRTISHEQLKKELGLTCSK